MSTKKRSWARLNLGNALEKFEKLDKRRSGSQQQEKQQESHLLALPDEILILIVKDCMSFACDPDTPQKYTDWAPLTRSCRHLYKISTEVWKTYTFILPPTIDLAKWSWRRPNTNPRPHERLSIYLHLPPFIKLPGDIRMPPTRFIHKLSLNWEAAWVVASHSNERFAMMPEMPALRTVTFGPFAYASPWTMSAAHGERLDAYRSSALSLGGFGRGAALWARFLPKCPALESISAIRSWETEEERTEVGKPMSRRLVDVMRADSMEGVQRKILILDSVLRMLVGNLLMRRKTWVGTWQDLVDLVIDLVERDYLRRLARC